MTNILIISKIRVLILLIIITGCATTKKRWENAKSIDNIQAYEDFLKKHPSSEYTGQARLRLEELWWKNAQSADNISAYQTFLQKIARPKSRIFHPSVYTAPAKARLEELWWEQAQSADNISAYKMFLEKHPSSQYTTQARARLAEFSWEQAQSADNISAYKMFLKEYPSSRFSKIAKSRIKKFQFDAFRNVKTVRIATKQSIGNAPDLKLPFEKWVSSSFEIAGVNVVDRNFNDPDGTLLIQVSGWPKSAKYFYEGKEYRLYTGGRLRGTISLMANNVEISRNFSGMKKPPDFVGLDMFESLKVPLGQDGLRNKAWRLSTPSEVTFRDIIFDEFYPKLYEVIGEAFGIPTLLLISAKTGWLSRRDPMFDILVNMGFSAVDPLIAALNHEDDSVRRIATSVLRKITGQRFESDYDVWREWWNRNRK